MIIPIGLFQILWRYSQLKVHHRCHWHQWQMEKIFNHKSFNYFIWTPLGSRDNLKIHFCLQVHFKVSAAWYCSHYLPPVSTTLVKLVAKFATSVVDTGSAAWLANISANFRKNWNSPNGILWGWGKLITEKNQKQKILWHCPCKILFQILMYFKKESGSCRPA